MRMNHYIIVKYNETIPNKDALFPEIEALFQGILEIPGIYGVKLYPNCTPRDNRYDLMIAIEMEQEALDAYDHSRPHLQWKQQYSQYIAKKAIFDCLAE